MSGFLGNEPVPIDEYGWLHTGDAGRVSDDGYLYLTGRIKEIIIRGGENISVVHVEEVLASHPAVAEVAVVGLPHQEMGEQVGAVLTLKGGASVGIEELIEHVQSKIGRYQTPTKWWIRQSPLPTNAMGKIVRKEIREVWLEHGAVNIIAIERGRERSNSITI